MRVFNVTKSYEILDYDLKKGYLKPDTLFIKHHEAILPSDGKFHYEVIKKYPNGGKDVEQVWDELPIQSKEAYDEYENIKIFIPYTAEELVKARDTKYKQLIEEKIREKYSISDEIGLLRQQNDKPEEYTEYYTYVEQCKATAKAEIYAIYGF